MATALHIARDALTRGTFDRVAGALEFGTMNAFLPKNDYIALSPRS